MALVKSTHQGSRQFGPLRGIAKSNVLAEQEDQGVDQHPDGPHCGLGRRIADWGHVEQRPGNAQVDAEAQHREGVPQGGTAADLDLARSPHPFLVEDVGHEVDQQRHAQVDPPGVSKAMS